MAKKKGEAAYVAPTAAAKEIKKLLEQNTAIGRRLHEVFDDFIELAEAALRMEPHHLLSQTLHGCLAAEPDDVAELWTKKRAIYSRTDAGSKPYFDRFTLALAILKKTAKEEWRDTIGDLYMEVGSNAWNGQFFTPFPLAQMMAQMTCTEVPALVYERIREAIAATDGAAALIAAHNLDATAAGDDEWVWHELMPLIWPQFTPVSIYDPAVGSAVTLVAAASALPKYMSEWGLVEFKGQDIDATCCLLASINMMLYGLNGHALRCKLAAGEDIRPERGSVDWPAFFGLASQAEALVEDLEDGGLGALLMQLQGLAKVSEPA
jgi:type I restriction-modification system DNA methylase subunit